MIPILAALAAAQAPATPPAPAASDDARYRSCTAMIRAEPQRAVETATAWQRSGGGIEARQCLGLAYVQLEMWASAATAFEQAAEEAQRTSDARRAELLVQAGNAWLAVDEAGNAIRNFDAALAATSLTEAMRGEVHLDRARARISLDEAAGAREDVDRALQLVAADPFAWYMSAALARRQNDLPRARTDIARARQLAPDNSDIMLLAGTIAGLDGNMAEAERLYRRVIEVAPDSPAGRAAQESLATLREVEVPAPAAPSPNQPPAPPTQTSPQPQPQAPQPD